jgi:hypothetical protein
LIYNAIIFKKTGIISTMHFKYLWKPSGAFSKSAI